MEPADNQQNDTEEQPTSTTISVPPETLRIVGMATGLISALMLAGSVLVHFLLGAFEPAIILAGIALIDPVVMQFVLSRLRPGGVDVSEVDLDSPFERYFYEKELEQSQGGQLGHMTRQLTGPMLGGAVLLMIVGMIMDAADLSAKVLPLFVLWAGAAFVLAMYAGSVFNPVGGDR